MLLGRVSLQRRLHTQVVAADPPRLSDPAELDPVLALRLAGVLHLVGLAEAAALPAPVRRVGHQREPNAAGYKEKDQMPNAWGGRLCPATEPSVCPAPRMMELPTMAAPEVGAAAKGKPHSGVPSDAR